MNNIPVIKLGIVAVSRDCFPASLAENRRKALVAAYAKKYNAADIYECPITIIESEIDMVNALEDIKKNDCNALCVYLGNFGPEISETLLAKHFDGPKMLCAAAEESQNDLIDGRGDAYCGVLNASYNLALRNTKCYIPDYPVGNAEECADMIHDFLPVARVAYGLSNLKIITFGPRPSNFLACNAPIKQLYNLDIEVEEESELDLFESYQKHEGDERIAEVAADMAQEMHYEAGKEPEMLRKLAQYELTLLDWAEAHKGYRKYVALTTKCWPAFQDMFKFVPCYVNSRLMRKGIPVSCEVDIYGTLSEYIGLCGNTCSTKLTNPHLSFQRIMARTHPQDWCDGTIEGDIAPSKITFYRLQSTADNKLRAYAAEGEVLPVATRSFGGIGVFGIKEMGRFYRYILVGKNYPHHGAVMFGHYGKNLYDALKYIGVDPSEIGYNQPEGVLYEDENPFTKPFA